MIRMPHLNWPQRLAVVAGLTVFGLVGGMELPNAGATNAGTAVSSTCGADGHWVVTMSVTSQYDGVIHIQLTDPHGPTPVMALAPFATKTITEHPDTGSTTWTWAWTSTDGHLTGPAVSGTVNRPDGCGTPPPTSGTTTTTTCAQAIPPRSDCAPITEVTTSPSTSTSVAIAIGSTSPSSSPPATIESDITTTAPSTVTSPRVRSSSSTSPLNLPATGAGDWLLAVAALGGIAIGVILVLVTAKRIDRSHEGEQ